MKLTLTLLAVSIAMTSLFSSCAKEVTIIPTEYYMKLKVNESWVTLKKTALQVHSSDARMTSGPNLTAYDDSLGMFFSIAIGKSGNDITPGSYSVSDKELAASLKIEKMGRYLEYNSETETGYKVPEYTLVIESVEEYYVKGSFKGNLLIDHKHQQTLEITEGEFIIQRK